MEKIYDNIYMKRFIYFNLYVIKGTDGDILIDTGFIGIRRNLKKWLDNFNIKLVILTHAHVDHIWNASYIQKLYNCDVALAYKDIKNINNSNIKSTPSKPKYKTWTKLMNWGMNHFNPQKFNINIKLQNNQIINNYGINLKIIELPGHTNGSIGILYKNYLFAGDALVNRGKIPSLAFQNQDNKKAYSSLKEIININPKVIFVGHDKEIIMNEKIKNKIITNK